jgi:hypothetical protein
MSTAILLSSTVNGTVIPDLTDAKEQALARNIACLEDLDSCMNNWMSSHDKGANNGQHDHSAQKRSVSSEMSPQQKKAFIANVATIAAINADPEKTWVAEFTSNMDMTDEEWRARYLMKGEEPLDYLAMQKRKNLGRTITKRDTEFRPVDWRNNSNTQYGSKVTNFVTPVRNQGQCGSC